MTDERYESEDLLSSTTLGVIGTSPQGIIGPVRSSRLDRFQRQVGQIEAYRASQYLAGHAACHALMNGISRVVFLGVDDPVEADSLAEAVTRLLESPPVDLLVVPGVVDVDSARAAVEAFERWSERMPGGRPAPSRPSAPVTLWLDPPQTAGATEVVAHRQKLGGDPGRVRVATPWVSTITPGRRAAEPLPPSCLVGPLYLGTTTHLKGVHEIGGPPEPAVREQLRRAGCGLLVPEGIRRLVRLAFPPPVRWVPREENIPPGGLTGRIEHDLRNACEPALGEQENGPGLWKTLVRQARGVLMAYQNRGEITRFGVRCDEETNLEMVDGVAMEVWIQVPRQVREIIFRVSMRGD